MVISSGRAIVNGKRKRPLVYSLSRGCMINGEVQYSPTICVLLYSNMISDVTFGWTWGESDRPWGSCIIERGEGEIGERERESERERVGERE